MKNLLALFMLSLTLFSCKKDKEENQAKSKTTLLTQNTWRPVLVQRRSDPADAWETNNFSMQACNLDDVWTFGTTGSYLWDEGATMCGSGSQTKESGTWSFTNSESHLSISITNIPGVTPVEDWTIEQLDENTFIYNFYFPTGPYYRYTMSH